MGLRLVKFKTAPSFATAFFLLGEESPTGLKNCIVIYQLLSATDKSGMQTLSRLVVADNLYSEGEVQIGDDDDVQLSREVHESELLAVEWTKARDAYRMEKAGLAVPPVTPKDGKKLKPEAQQPNA